MEFKKWAVLALAAALTFAGIYFFISEDQKFQRECNARGGSVISNQCVAIKPIIIE